MEKKTNFFIYILHFHLDDNAPCLSPKALHSDWFQLLLAITVVPNEIKDNTYAKFRGGISIMIYVKMVNLNSSLL